MKRLRYVQIPSDDIKVDETYLMAAIPTLIQPGPGKAASERKLNMQMVPCRLEWVDAETGDRSPVLMEKVEPLRIVIPKRI